MRQRPRGDIRRTDLRHRARAEGRHGRNRLQGASDRRREGRPMSLEHALYSLLYRRRAREALVASDADRLGISGQELALLATVDRDQLERAARLVTEGILSRAYQG